MNKKLLTALLLSLTVTLTACGTAGGTTGGGNKKKESGLVSAGDVKVWSVASTEKVLQDKLDGYDEIEQPAEINVFTAKGEYEGSQIILTSENKYVSGINLTANDLKIEGGSETFSKDNVEVFFEKYVTVSQNYERNGAPLGNYPDALVPMDAIIEAEENEMSASTNQGLYVRFNVPEDQKAGVYTGNYTLNYGGNTKTVPVTLEVMDLTVSEETHSRSYFISSWQYRLGELDSTQEMYEKYVNAGFEYRISPSVAVVDSDTTEEGLDYYVERAVEFMKNPKCTHVSIPFKSATVGGVSGFDTAFFEDVLYKFIDKSIEDGQNYVKKLGSHLVDEPQLNNTFAMTQKKTELFYSTIEKVANDFMKMSVPDEEFQLELANSVRNLRAVITASYEDAYDGVVRTWCPTVDYYDSEANRAVYDEQERLYYEGNEEKWWYTCISPRAPYPTYHIEDTLLSARTLSWMQAEYDVVGNLFWATNVYANYDGSKYVNIEDFYTGNASRFAQVNGDGYLFYPGKKYGIDGPVGSLRLEAIRDGLEEYEILYQFKNNYGSVAEMINGSGYDVNAKRIINNLTSSLYTGTRVSTTSAEFDVARRALYSLAIMSNTDAKLTVIDTVDNNKGQISYKLFVGGDGYSLYSGNELQTATATVTGGKIYNVVYNLENDVNVLNLKLKKGDEEYVFTRNLGGKVVKYGADTLQNAFTAENATVDKTVVGAQDVCGEDGDILKLVLGSTTTKSQRIKFGGDIVNTMTANTKKVVIRVYVSSQTDFTVYVKTAKSNVNRALGTFTLDSGMNEISLNLSSINFAVNGDAEYLLFLFGDTDSETVEPSRTVYIKDMIVYDK